MALKVPSVAATGTAISTMSDPATASSADSAATSMMPSFFARSVVDGDVTGDNKGSEAAETALEMAAVLDRLRVG